MTESELLETISIPEYAERLTEPFTMIDLVQVDDLALSIYLCQGTMPRHRHLDQDELFLVHSGTISLESDWGSVILRPGELAVAPKGVGHRSSSLLRSLVLLLQPRLMVNRRNGHRRLFALKGEQKLEKVNVPAMGRQLSALYHPLLLADLDTFALHLLACSGIGPWQQTERQDSLILCYKGRVTVDTSEKKVFLGDGELVIVPKGMAYRLSSLGRSLVLSVERHQQPGLPLPD